MRSCASAHHRQGAGRRLPVWATRTRRVSGCAAGCATGGRQRRGLVTAMRRRVAAMVEACRRGPRAATVADVAVGRPRTTAAPISRRARPFDRVGGLCRRLELFRARSRQARGAHDARSPARPRDAAGLHQHRSDRGKREYPSTTSLHSRRPECQKLQREKFGGCFPMPSGRPRALSRKPVLSPCRPQLRI